MIHHEIKKKKMELPNKKRASNRAVPGADNRASKSKNELLDRIVSNGVSTFAVDADFDAPAKSKNEYDSSDEENEHVVELFGVWQ